MSRPCLLSVKDFRARFVQRTKADVKTWVCSRPQDLVELGTVVGCGGSRGCFSVEKEKEMSGLELKKFEGGYIYFPSISLPLLILLCTRKIRPMTMTAKD